MKSAFPSVHNPVTLTLYANIPFDNTYKHHSLISDLFKYNGTTVADNLHGTTCEQFINRIDYATTGQPFVYPRWTMTDTFNFNFTNGLLGSVVLELTSEQTNANYLKVACAGGVNYYYFITGINQLNADTYTLTLECDVIMTYQDEFLTGMKDVPVFTARKHCHRYSTFSLTPANDGLVPFSADLKTGEDMFAGVKPSHISYIDKLYFADTQLAKMKGIMWLYVCVDVDYTATNVSDVTPLYTYKDKTFPFVMMAMPINVDELIYKKSDGTCVMTFSKAEMLNALGKLIGDGSVHGAKISPYPPFTNNSLPHCSITYSGGTLTISSTSVTDSSITGLNIYTMDIGLNKLVYGSVTGFSPDNAMWYLYDTGFVIVATQKEVLYQHTAPAVMSMNNLSKPDITKNRYKDPKLLFEPFMKYILTAQYSSNGSEFFPELAFSRIKYTPTQTETMFDFSTYATAYIGDDNYYTLLSGDGFTNYKYDKIGLSSSVNYIFPCGTDALDVFNATQKQSFYTSKVASGVTSGLQIAGGVGAVGLGIAGMVGTVGMSTPVSVGLIATGTASIASGVAGIANTVKSADAKIEDLKNTPDTINVSGSNFIIDDAVNYDTYCMPYIVVYTVSDVTLENANDFFYRYGWQTARDTYFNTELKINENATIDNNLFGRTIFNYIQLNEDITNKINANIPLIIKQKLSTIFNQGITLWTFFGFDGLWTDDDPSSTYYVDKWFMKNKLDNTEYYGETNG